ncbi:four helix bundle protein [Pontibacter sp. H259]|uniref:four helix bundle protein n=1 Tax=Pontibacter sp. H259 TaxID=3133421 RepID=UPI0030C3153F
MEEVKLSNYAFAELFKLRTKNYALRIVKLFQSLPNKPEAHILGKQLLRSSTSVAANYRAACRARSKAEFISKIGVVLEEADESLFWIEILEESEIVNSMKLSNLKQEALALTAILATTRKNASRNK